MNGSKRAALLLACLVAGCGDSADFDILEGTGPNPRLPAPTETLIPTVHVAEAVGLGRIEGLLVWSGHVVESTPGDRPVRSSLPSR